MLGGGSMASFFFSWLQFRESAKPFKFFGREEVTKEFANWMISPKGQKAIGEFKVDGKQLFCPNAEKKKKNSLLACPAN